jgi:cytochrome c oxidase subunit 2
VLGTVVALAACGADDVAPVPLSADGTRGQEISRALGCNACHSADGSPRQGPTYRGQWGRTIDVGGGKTVVYDAAYVTESIRDPAALRRPAFTGTMTPVDQTRLSDSDLGAVIAYLRDLGAG